MELEKLAFEKLPSGIRQDLELSYGVGREFPFAAIRQWIEIKDEVQSTGSRWAGIGYASNRQYAGIIGESLYKTSGHMCEVWSLYPSVNNVFPGPYILDYVPGIGKPLTRPAGLIDGAHQKPRPEGRMEPSDENIGAYCGEWVKGYYQLHPSNYKYVKMLKVEHKDQGRIYTCTMNFSRNSDQVTLRFHNLPGGFSVFALEYAP